MKSSDLKELLFSTFGHLVPAQIMGLTIYGEARGESGAGKIAVGSVILERVDHRDWDGKTVQEVCLCPYQFSCFLPNDPNFNALKMIAQDWEHKYLQSKDLQDCFHIALDLLAGRILRQSDIAENHAMQYLTTALRKSKACPDWVRKMKRVATVDNHEFYA